MWFTSTVSVFSGSDSNNTTRLNDSFDCFSKALVLKFILTQATLLLSLNFFGTSHNSLIHFHGVIVNMFTTSEQNLPLFGCLRQDTALHGSVRGTSRWLYECRAS